TAVVPLGAPLDQLPASLQFVPAVPFHEVDWPDAAETRVKAAPRTTIPKLCERRRFDIAELLGRPQVWGESGDTQRSNHRASVSSRQRTAPPAAPHFFSSSFPGAHQFYT